LGWMGSVQVLKVHWHASKSSEKSKENAETTLLRRWDLGGCRYFEVNSGKRMTPVTLRVGSEVWQNPAAQFTQRSEDRCAPVSPMALHLYEFEH
jgi:hypothetical protein